MEENKSSSATDSYETESTSDDEVEVQGNAAPATPFRALESLVQTTNTESKKTPSIYPVLPSEEKQQGSQQQSPDFKSERKILWAMLGVTIVGGIAITYWHLRR